MDIKVFKCKISFYQACYYLLHFFQTAKKIVHLILNVQITHKCWKAVNKKGYFFLSYQNGY